MDTGVQCILGKWQDNGANRAPNSRIKVNKTLTENKETYVINDLIVYVTLCCERNRKRNTFLIVMRSLSYCRVIQSLLTFSRKSRRGFGRVLRLAVSNLLQQTGNRCSRFLASVSDLVSINIFGVNASRLRVRTVLYDFGGAWLRETF
jgi:hypothetical protein